MTKLAACLKDNGLLIFWSRGNAASPLSLPGFLLTVVSDRVLCHVYSDSGTSIFPLCWAAGAVGEELLPMGWTHGGAAHGGLPCLLWEGLYAGAGAGVLPLRRKERQSVKN